MTVKAALAGMFAAGMLFGVGAANAADMGRPVYKAPMEAAPAFSWTGFYIGAVTGYAWGDADIGGGVLGLLGSTQQTKPDGWIAGGTVGYNYQQGNLVLGTEGEFFWSNVDGTSSNGILGINGTYSNDWTGAVSTRLGVAFGTFLVYSKAGIAWAKNEYTLNALGGGGTLSTSETETGWLIGSGVEWAFAPNWSAKIEGTYMDFGSRTRDFNNGVGVPLSANVDSHISNVKFGVNYRF